MCLSGLVFVNLTQPRYIWEEGILIEKITIPEYSKWQKKVEYKEKHVILALIQQCN